jgi:hypothetical protein
MLRLSVWRDPAVFLHCARASIVSGECLAVIPSKGLELLLQVSRTAVKALYRIERIANPQPPSGSGHELRQAKGTSGGTSMGVKAALLIYESNKDVGIDSLCPGDVSS